MVGKSHIDVTLKSLHPVVFFFSSRRRHTRFDCDWSSDVCSSDLAIFAVAMGRLVGSIQRGGDLAAPLALVGIVFVLLQVLPPIHQVVGANLGSRTEIGRASCRERV